MRPWELVPASLMLWPLVLGQSCATPASQSPSSPAAPSLPASTPPAAAAPVAVDWVNKPTNITDPPASTQYLTYRLGSAESGYIWTIAACKDLETSSDPLGQPDPKTLIASLGSFERDVCGHFSWFWWPLATLPLEVEEVTLNLFCLDTSGRDVDVVIHFLQQPLPAFEPGGGGQAWCLAETPFSVVGTWLNVNLNPGEWLAVDITDCYWRWGGQHWQRPQPNYGIALDAGWQGQWAKFSSSDASTPEDRCPHLTIRYYPAVARKLLFPLEGGYGKNRVSGYHFGEWWENKTCPGSKDTKFWHTGTDFGGQAGDKVYAALTGQIKCADLDETWGGYVVLEHCDGDRVYTTTYTHVTPLAGLTVGHWLSRGMQLGTIAPIASPHLHFGVRLKPYHATWSRRGSLPGSPCITAGDLTEPQWPESFVNPENLDWK